MTVLKTWADAWYPVAGMMKVFSGPTFLGVLANPVSLAFYLMLGLLLVWGIDFVQAAGVPCPCGVLNLMLPLSMRSHKLSAVPVWATVRYLLFTGTWSSYAMIVACLMSPYTFQGKQSLYCSTWCDQIFWHCVIIAKA